MRSAQSLDMSSSEAQLYYKGSTILTWADQLMDIHLVLLSPRNKPRKWFVTRKLAHIKSARTFSHMLVRTHAQDVWSDKISAWGKC